MTLVGRWQAGLLLALLQLPGAQQTDSRSGLIVGQVVDAGSNRAVAGAIVAMTGPPGPNGQPRPPVLTGPDGRFVFRDMARGNYNVTAVKPGFVEGAHGRTRPGGQAIPLAMGDAERRDSVVLRLWRQAAISGTVLDEAGEPQVGLVVRAYRRSVVGGKLRFVPGPIDTTDDRGVYRMGTLTPGDYIVGTAPRNTSIPLSVARDGVQGVSFAGEVAGRGGALIIRDTGYVLGRGSATPPPPAGGRLVVYPPTYHPSAPAGDAASIISLQPGQDREGADIQLAPVGTVSVSGFINGPEGPATAATVRLVREATHELAADGDGITTISDRRGGFTFPAVPSGRYALRMNRGSIPGGRPESEVPQVTVWVDLPVSVGTEDITSLAVDAQPGLRISGRYEFDGDPSRPRGELRNLQISITSADSLEAARSYVARANASGEFTSPPLPGGRYYVRILDSPSGWMFRGATLDGRDVSDSALTLTADVSNVSLGFTDRWSGIRGSVQAERGSAADAAVIVFPTDSAMWESAGATARRMRMARVGSAGEYSFNLPAGDYYLLALPEDQAADWQHVGFLEEASRMAVRVRIAEGERSAQDLRLRGIR